jgi:hypothetical protein
LWERVARTRESAFVTGEGYLSANTEPAERYPSSGALRATFSHKGRRK